MQEKRGYMRKRRAAGTAARLPEALRSSVEEILVGLFAQSGVQQDVFLHLGDDAAAPQDLPGLLHALGGDTDPVDLPVDAAVAAKVPGVQLGPVTVSCR